LGQFGSITGTGNVVVVGSGIVDVGATVVISATVVVVAAGAVVSTVVVGGGVSETAIASGVVGSGDSALELLHCATSINSPTPASARVSSWGPRRMISPDYKPAPS
jgi:hypothetical protein